jgi:flagellar M-ring protein FliF
VGNVRRLTAAVVVNDRPADPAAGGAATPRSPEELARIQSLVQSAIGLDEQRGDVISVVSVPFGEPIAPAEEGLDLMSVAREAYRPMITLLAVVFAFLIGLRVLKGYGPAKGGEVGAPAGALRPAEERGEQGGAELAPAPRPEPIALARPELAVPSGPTLRDQVVQRLDEQPEVSLRLVRAWLKES